MAEVKDKQARRYILTINNPTQTDDEFNDYVKNLEHFKYCIFQREKGHECETEHFQVFIIFSIAKRFSTIKNYFPTAHIEETKGTNAQCRDYCSKSDTRVSGPYEIGEFAEQRARTDISNYLEMVRLGATDDELSKMFPNLYLSNINKNAVIRGKYLESKFLNKLRDIEVTYIYGKPGSGKTSYIYNNYEFIDVYNVPTYDYTAFDNYNCEDVLLLDEFTGQWSVQYMNKLIDRYPLRLRARFANKVACYTKVYIISNYKLSDLYKTEQNENLDIYNSFKRRIKNILRIEHGGKIIKERENFNDICLLQQNELVSVSEEEQKIADEIF